MTNPILKQMARQPSAAPPVQPTDIANNPLQLLRQFSEFKKTVQGRNPEAIVKSLLQSGKMTPEQFEQLKAQAASLQSLLK